MTSLRRPARKRQLAQPSPGRPAGHHRRGCAPLSRGSLPRPRGRTLRPPGDLRSWVWGQNANGSQKQEQPAPRAPAVSSPGLVKGAASSISISLSLTPLAPEQCQEFVQHQEQFQPPHKFKPRQLELHWKQLVCTLACGAQRRRPWPSGAGLASGGAAARRPPPPRRTASRFLKETPTQVCFSRQPRALPNIAIEVPSDVTPCTRFNSIPARTEFCLYYF